ncbi:MAG: hypothetical protein ACTSRP_10785, partial [Candidatus Helarchaeota archaeon]
SIIFENNLFFSTKFNEAAGEDISFSLDLVKNGIKITPLDHLKIMHWYGYNNNFNKDFKTFNKRFERYGGGEVKVLKNHPDFYNYLNKSIERSCLFNLLQYNIT